GVRAISWKRFTRVPSPCPLPQAGEGKEAPLSPAFFCTPAVDGISTQHAAQRFRRAQNEGAARAGRTNMRPQLLASTLASCMIAALGTAPPASGAPLVMLGDAS